MSKIKKVTVEFKDGNKLTIKPKHPATLVSYQGLKEINDGTNYTKHIRNGIEVHHLLIAPDNIGDTILPICDEHISKLIND